MNLLKNQQQLLITFIPAILVLMAVAIASIVLNIDIAMMTRDISVIGKVNPLAGVISNLGILLWCVAASVAFFAAIILRKSGQVESFWFLLNAAFLSAYLMLDDLFLFHEYIAYLIFGIREKVVVLILGILVFWYLFRYRFLILKTNYIILILALSFLALSVITDMLMSSFLSQLLGHWRSMIEDGFKWLGIVTWCSYFVQTSFQFVIKDK